MSIHIESEGAAETSPMTEVEVATAALHVMSNHAREDFDALVAPDAVNREAIEEPLDTRGTGPDAFYATSLWLQGAFSDLGWEVHEAVHEHGLVALHTTMSGRQTGPFVTYLPDGSVMASFGPTGRRFAVTQTHWFRVRDGKVTEHWANRDDLGMGVQLGWGPPEA